MVMTGGWFIMLCPHYHVYTHVWLIFTYNTGWCFYGQMLVNIPAPRFAYGYISMMPVYVMTTDVAVQTPHMEAMPCPGGPHTCLWQPARLVGYAESEQKGFDHHCLYYSDG